MFDKLQKIHEHLQKLGWETNPEDFTMLDLGFKAFFAKKRGYTCFFVIGNNDFLVYRDR